MDSVKHPLDWWAYGGYDEVMRQTGWNLAKACRELKDAGYTPKSVRDELLKCPKFAAVMPVPLHIQDWGNATLTHSKGRLSSSNPP